LAVMETMIWSARSSRGKKLTGKNAGRGEGYTMPAAVQSTPVKLKRFSIIGEMEKKKRILQKGEGSKAASVGRE